jgi:hypothetical protein
MKLKWWQIIHWVIIINFLLGAGYAAYMIFFVVGGGAPLFQRAKDISIEILLKRRLYAIETWVIIGGLAVYLAVTEILPRKLASIREDPT